MFPPSKIVLYGICIISKYYNICVILVNELEQLHHKHGIRPDVFGDSEGEHEIEILTGEITQVKSKLNVQ